MNDNTDTGISEVSEMNPAWGMSEKRRTVVPAKAGTHVFQKQNRVPACAGTTFSELPPV
jgi:hypothetical protein